MSSNQDIYLNGEALDDLANKLKTKIEKVSENYSSIKNKLKDISGTNDIWQGEDQKIFCDTFDIIVSKYDGNIEKLNEIYEFLKKANKSYKTQDEGFERSLDINSDDMNM